ncbi:hypothetical protein CALVIDRAFT_525292 [Calocera viscosa TUFC12733]|uniref:Uncharacterized protein n=1 Tax=Calocera viscosa (strain TUFC12733) TaxID=1330018 RepID=A0A167QH03_CALVF|nr:hypothetical protein CALVIDRAFT_525292 [Calocera viscosa TUFC12733]
MSLIPLLKVALNASPSSIADNEPVQAPAVTSNALQLIHEDPSSISPTLPNTPLPPPYSRPEQNVQRLALATWEAGQQGNEDGTSASNQISSVPAVAGTNAPLELTVSPTGDTGQSPLHEVAYEGGAAQVADLYASRNLLLAELARERRRRHEVNSITPSYQLPPNSSVGTTGSSTTDALSGLNGGDQLLQRSPETVVSTIRRDRSDEVGQLRPVVQAETSVPVWRDILKDDLPDVAPAALLLPRFFLSSTLASRNELGRFTLPKYGHFHVATSGVPSTDNRFWELPGHQCIGLLQRLLWSRQQTTSILSPMDQAHPGTQAFLARLPRTIPVSKFQGTTYVIYLYGSSEDGSELIESGQDFVEETPPLSIAAELSPTPQPVSPESLPRELSSGARRMPVGTTSLGLINAPSFPSAVNYLATRFPHLQAAFGGINEEVVPAATTVEWFVRTVYYYFEVCSTLGMPSARPNDVFHGTAAGAWNGQLSPALVAAWFQDRLRIPLSRRTIINHRGVVARWRRIWVNHGDQYTSAQGHWSTPGNISQRRQEQLLLLGVIGYALARSPQERAGICRGTPADLISGSARTWRWNRVEDQIERLLQLDHSSDESVHLAALPG